VAFIEASLEELPVSANLGQSCLATKISAPGPSNIGWFRHRNIPSGVSLPSKESHYEALLIRVSKPGPSGVRQAPQIAKVRDCMDVPYKLPSNAEFETSYAVFKASRGCLEGRSHRGRASSPRTPSNGSEPRLANLRKRFM